MLYLLILLVFACSFIIKEKNIWNPGFVYNAFWFVILFLAQLRLFGLFEVSKNVLNVVLLGAICFSICPFYGSRISLSNVNIGIEKDFNESLFNMLWIVCFLGLIIIDSKAILFLLSGYSISDIRYLLGEQIFSSYLVTVANKFFFHPFAISSAIAFIASTIQKGYTRKDLLFKALVISVMEFIAVGDRMILFVFVIGVFTALFLIWKRNEYRLLLKRLKIIAILLVITSIFVMVMRGIHFSEIFESIYIYLTGGLILFSERFDGIMGEAGSTVIVSSLQGLLRPIMGVLEIFGIEWYRFDLASDFLLYNQHYATAISDNGGVFNYFVTCFAYMIKDAGYFGIVFINCIWGGIAQCSYRCLKKRWDILTIGIYLFIIIGICVGFMDFFLVEVSFAWGLVYFCIICMCPQICKVKFRFIRS